MAVQGGTQEHTHPFPGPAATGGAKEELLLPILCSQAEIPASTQPFRAGSSSTSSSALQSWLSPGSVPCTTLPPLLHDLIPELSHRTSELFYSCCGLSPVLISDLHPAQNILISLPPSFWCFHLVPCPGLQHEHKHATVCSPEVTLGLESVSLNSDPETTPTLLT